MLIGYKKDKSIKDILLDIISTVIVNMLVIIMATKIFKNISVDGVFYTFVVSLLLMLFNKSIKPILNIIMLPINIYTLGITYPFVNVIILKLISLLLGSHFVLVGWFSAFFISIFISIMTIIIDVLIGKEIRR
ncbi:MAG: phage holin family protein [Bacilli bacterium]|nr:phage holin family protein [Bacilli bacterium]